MCKKKNKAKTFAKVFPATYIQCVQYYLLLIPLPAHYSYWFSGS